MRDKSLLAAGALLAALLPLHVQADCKAKLAEVDQRMRSPQIPDVQRSSLKMFRDQAATYCSQGHEATAMQTLGVMEMMLPPSEAQQVEASKAKVAAANTKSRLTSDFLQGRWCSMTGEERAELQFAADGTYRPCFPKAGAKRYVCNGKPMPTAQWLARHERDDSRDPDVIELSSPSKGGGSMVYRRGECGLHGR